MRPFSLCWWLYRFQQAINKYNLAISHYNQTGDDAVFAEIERYAELIQWMRVRMILKYDNNE